ncbi:hypothetical protein ACFYYH_30545 [Streptomyces sp. NPDC002018]|uniref:hypothetical protein n=1 Tax=Streptomyces sp. NPDC002018 TaxID=3364629 RepID=UPI0036A35962
MRSLSELDVFLGVHRAALSDAYRRGIRSAMLGAEAGAVGLYRRLGFVAGGEMARLRAPAP